MNDPLRLLQLTDTHLFADPGRELRAVQTAQSLAAVVAAVQRDARWPADAVLATGDLSEDRSPQSYLHLRTLLAPLERPVHCLPGNHDDPATMQSLLSTPPFSMQSEIVFDHWAVLMLDSRIADSNAGELGGEQRALLESVLQRQRDRHVMVCLHHHPIPMESAWLDCHLLADADRFHAILDRHGNARAVLWGHVHQPFDERRDGRRMLATPSTCRQFRPRSTSFATDDRPPAWRWLSLYPDGRIDTAVSWLNDVEDDNPD